MRDELRSNIGFNQENWLTAARFCAQNKINLEEALTWVDQSVSNAFIGVENFNTYQTRALIYTALGRTADADASMDKAIKDPGATVPQIHMYGRSLLTAGQNAKALEVFKYNAQKNPQDKFTPNVGLARGYAATGDKKSAIKYWDLALKNIPAEQKQFLPQYEAELKKLKEGK